jgi:hypothetical protein
MIRLTKYTKKHYNLYNHYGKGRRKVMSLRSLFLCFIHTLSSIRTISLQVPDNVIHIEDPGPAV